MRQQNLSASNFTQPCFKRDDDPGLGVWVFDGIWVLGSNERAERVGLAEVDLGWGVWAEIERENE